MDYTWNGMRTIKLCVAISSVHREFIKWTFPSLNWHAHCCKQKCQSKIKTEWQTVQILTVSSGSTLFAHCLARYVGLFLNLISEKQIQSTLVISNSKGLSEILRDIRTSTYQVCRIEKKIIRTTTFDNCICNWTLDVLRYIENIVEKRRNCSFSSFPQYFYLLLDFNV